MHKSYQGMSIYRALVSYSSTVTGEITVKIPSILGGGPSLPVSAIGRKSEAGVWKVPEVGDQVLVAIEDDRFSNIYLIYPQASIS